MLGFRLNWADPVLRRVVIAAVTLNCGGPIFVTVLPILAYRGLGHDGRRVRPRHVGRGRSAACSARSSRRGSAAGSGSAARWPSALLLHNLVGLGILAAPTLPPAPGDRA